MTLYIATAILCSYKIIKKHVFTDLPDFQAAMRAATMTLDTATGIYNKLYLITSVV